MEQDRSIRLITDSHSDKVGWEPRAVQCNRILSLGLACHLSAVQGAVPDQLLSNRKSNRVAAFDRTLKRGFFHEAQGTRHQLEKIG